MKPNIPYLKDQQNWQPLGEADGRDKTQITTIRNENERIYSWLYGNKKALNECHKPFYNNTLYKLDKMDNFLESKKNY